MRVTVLDDRGRGFIDRLLWLCLNAFWGAKLLSDGIVYFTGDNELNFDVMPVTEMNDGFFIKSCISQENDFIKIWFQP